MKRKTPSRRSGLYHRKQQIAVNPKRQTPEEMKQVFQFLLSEIAFKNITQQTELKIEALEEVPKAVYLKHGLPVESGRYLQEQGGGFRLLELQEELDVAEAAISSLIVPRIFDRCALGVTRFGPDHETAFAGDIFRSLDLLRRNLERAIEEENMLAVQAMLSAMVAMATVSRWSEEFELAVWIEPERRSAPKRSSGGVAKAKTANRQAHWSRWRQAACEVWANQPNLSKSRVAEIVKRKLDLSEGVETIRKRIRKLGSC